MCYNTKGMKKIVAVLLALAMVFQIGMGVPGLGMTIEAQAAARTKRIELSEKQVSMSVGMTHKLAVKAALPKGASKKVKWTTSNKKVVSVSSKGVLSAKKAGSAKITAVSTQNKKVKAVCKVKVYEATKKLKLTCKSKCVVLIDNTVKLSAKVTSPKKGAQPVQWSSKNSKIATVSKKGVVTGKKIGKTTIIGQSGKKKVKVIVTVKKNDLAIKDSNLSYDEESNAYYLKDTLKQLHGILKNAKKYSGLSYKIQDENGNTIDSGKIKLNKEWVIKNPGLLSGDNTLIVTAKGKQPAVLTVHICDPFGYNLQNLKDYDKDTDQDGLIDYLEDSYGTDKTKKDTDGDGLDDLTEVSVLNTDPLKKDSDGNGVSDYDEDIDGDGLSNGLELKYQTDPVGQDTDMDGLLDGEEVNQYKTDPLKEDTDEDGASDKWEVDNKTDPLSAQTSFEAEAEAEVGMVAASVELELPGDQADTLTVTPDLENKRLDSTLPGYMGVPYKFEVDGTFSGTAELSFSYDSSLVTNGTEKPTIYYYNESTQMLEELETTVNTQTNTATAKVNHFSTYILLNKTEFDQVWRDDIRTPSTTNQKMNGMDVVFVIDSSGSMKNNDKDNLRKEAAKRFVDKLGVTDRAAVIDFDSKAKVIQGFTFDHTAIYDGIDAVDSSGGTSLKAGISAGTGLFTEEYYRQDAYKYIIFLTDGDGTYSDSCTTAAKDAGITIYTIGLGKGVKESVLKKIASGTGGKYYFASTAESLMGIYTDMAEEAIDYQKDSNNDGISDYYTQVLCEGSLYVNGTKNPFAGISYDDVQMNADFDGDGLLNGEELVLSTYVDTATGDDHVKIQLLSDPTNNNSDDDIYSDYDEVRKYHTDPMCTNMWFDQEDITYLTTKDNFVAQKYLDLYDSKVLGAGEKAGIWLGNNIFGSNHDTVYMYKSVLMNYLEETQKQSENSDLYDFICESNSILSQMNTSVGETSKHVNKAQKKVLENLRQQLQTSRKNMNDIVNGDLVHNGFTKKQIYEMYDDALAQYQTVAAQIPEMDKKITINTKIGKASEAVGVAFDVLDIGATMYDFFSEYSEFSNSVGSMQDAVTVLETIRDSGEADDHLKQACIELIRAITEQYTVNMDAFWDGVTTIGGKTLHVVAGYGVGLIPVVGPYLEAVNLAIGLADFAFNISDVSQACTYLVAITRSANIFSADFLTNLERSSTTADNGRLVYSNCGKFASDYYYLAILRKVSEQKMREADEANSFLTEWVFTDYLYKVTDINANISQIEQIQNKYMYVK